MGYKTLIGGVNISKDSIKMYHCKDAIIFYEAMIGKRKTSKVITSLFHIQKIKLGLYHIKINEDTVKRKAIHNDGNEV